MVCTVGLGGRGHLGKLKHWSLSMVLKFSGSVLICLGGLFFNYLYGAEHEAPPACLFDAFRLLPACFLCSFLPLSLVFVFYITLTASFLYYSSKLQW